jgi:hypothetical protein
MEGAFLQSCMLSCVLSCSLVCCPAVLYAVFGGQRPKHADSAVRQPMGLLCGPAYL